MRTSILLFALLLCTGCVASGAGPLPVCDGLSRRPANPYGSVLEPSPHPAAPPSDAGAANPPTGGCA
jgi:hypothetical protein